MRAWPVQYIRNFEYIWKLIVGWEMVMSKLPVAVCALMFWIGTAVAGPVADFEKALRDVYGDYRTALFLTNAGKHPESVKSITAFKVKWAGLEKSWGISPPPQYADDPKWKQSLDEVSATVAKAASEIESGALPAAHITLEAVREAIAGLHERNGIVSFSDRMNAYHRTMEHVLGRDISTLDAAAIDDIQEQAAILQYLANDAISHPPAEAAGSPEFEGLARAVSASADAVVAAARTGDSEKLKAGLGKLKPAYAKLFLKFG